MFYCKITIFMIFIICFIDVHCKNKTFFAFVGCCTLVKDSPINLYYFTISTNNPILILI